MEPDTDFDAELAKLLEEAEDLKLDVLGLIRHYATLSTAEREVEEPRMKHVMQKYRETADALRELAEYYN